ncbi:hypothetical protein G3545_27975 [Starkeya sp. ORNL1]|uniref:hypothetical protein n=1 Tax=Starkeya sp. ORNL1 TaxID=2709380 RepID=UPI001462F5B3|nr:hypothetical protein [Starkeya sp. ORNL1]QJP17144.1 hypothetical protein G3545_27975 [Starkeya sp. ORNL1]
MEITVCDCFDDDDDDVTDKVLMTPEMIKRMRSIEHSLPGQPVPSETWAIFLGEASGSLPWGYLERLMRCRQIAGDWSRHMRIFRPHQRARTSLSCL